MTNDQRFYSLIDLMEATTAACQDAVANKLHDAYVAAHVRPLEARQWTNNDGQRGYSVIVSDAAPTAIRLQAHIRAYLEKAGFNDIEVITEW